MSNEDLDLSLKVLNGRKSIKIKDVCELKPLTLDEITELTYTKYNFYLRNLVSDIDDLKLGIDLSDFSFWDLLLYNMVEADEKVKTAIIESFECFLRTEVRFDKDNLCFWVGNKIINKLIFEEIVAILKIQNCVRKQEEEFKTASKKADEIKRKILEGRKRMEKGSEITLFDLISVLAANGQNGLNIMNIWDLTFFQFNDQFGRMQLIDNYNLNIRYLIAGAKASELDLKHYISPISNKK